MDGAGGPTRGAFASRASAFMSTAPIVEAYDRGDVEAMLAAAAAEQASLQAAIDEARRAALQPPMPLDMVARVDADLAIEVAEANLASLRAQLASAEAQLRQTQHVAGVPTPTPPAAPVAQETPASWATPVVLPPPPVYPTAAPTYEAPAAPAPTYTAPPTYAAAPPVAPAEVPTVAVPQVVQPQIIVQRVKEPYSRTTGLLQVITWSIVVAVVLIVLLAWFA